MKVIPTSWMIPTKLNKIQTTQNEIPVSITIKPFT